MSGSKLETNNEIDKFFWLLIINISQDVPHEGRPKGGLTVFGWSELEFMVGFSLVLSHETVYRACQLSGEEPYLRTGFYFLVSPGFGSSFLLPPPLPGLRRSNGPVRALFT